MVPEEQESHCSVLQCTVNTAQNCTAKLTYTVQSNTVHTGFTLEKPRWSGVPILLAAQSMTILVMLRNGLVLAGETKSMLTTPPIGWKPEQYSSQRIQIAERNRQENPFCQQDCGRSGVKTTKSTP